MIGPRSGRAPTAGTSRFRRLFDRGSWSVPPIVLAPALLGGVLLAVVVATSWPYFADEHAYWTAAQRFAAGQPLYDASAPVFTPYAYWYPPVLAQVLSPLTLVAPDWLFSAAWTALVVACLWYLSGRNLLVALALIAFLPVALELQARNVHLVIAALIVLALRRSWLFWIPATALKLAPVVGVLYLVAAGRRREAVLTGIFGLALTGISVVLAPQAWTDFLHVAAGRAAASTGGLLDVPYAARLGAGALLAIVAGWRGGRAGEVGLVVAITIANPTLWANALSMLVAAVALLRTVPDGRAAASAPDASGHDAARPGIATAEG